MLENHPKTYFKKACKEKHYEWKIWLPQCFSTPKRNYSDESIDSYYSPIPSEILEIWANTKKMFLFDSYEIWTAENFQTENLLVGFFKNEAYPIARWGKNLRWGMEVPKIVEESERIKRKVNRQKKVLSVIAFLISWIGLGFLLFQIDTTEGGKDMPLFPIIVIQLCMLVIAILIGAGVGEWIKCRADKKATKFLDSRRESDNIS